MGKIRCSFSILLLLFFSHLSFSQVKTSPIPDWVKSEPETANSAHKPTEGGYTYLLFERQYHVPQKTSFSRYKIQVLTVDGIQENSDISINYDPSYQTLHIHDITIRRDGKAINKLNLSEIKTIQKESGSNQFIYDGSLSAIIHLSDVQKQDIIEYSYSIKGFNPVNKDFFSADLYHQLYFPVKKFKYRIITSADKGLQYRNIDHQYSPTIEEGSGMKIYTWENEALSPKMFDINVPNWLATYPMTSVSNFSGWEEVVSWALPLYQYDKKDIAPISKRVNNKALTEEKIPELIRMVQDDIRYLGLESGMSAYRPNAPKKVFDQKFGDCKDKSLLLVALLREEGVKAYPLLVNTEWRSETKALQPSQSAFDHCVVTYEWEGKNYFVDPTISDQGGSFEDSFFPDYGVGLVIKEGVKDLIEIPRGKVPYTKINELITVNDFSGKAEYIVRSEMYGRKADETRAYFANKSKEEITQEYMNYYANLYPGISTTAVVKLMDYNRNGENLLTVEEYYQIPDFWQKADDSTYVYGQIYPIVLESLLELPKSANRTMDYFVGDEEEFYQTTQVVLPEDWNITPFEKTIEASAFTYQNKIFGAGNTVVVEHSLKRLKNTIPAIEVAELLKKKEEVMKELSFYVTHTGQQKGSSSNLGQLSILLALIIFGFWIYFGIKLYKNYDPDPWIYAENKSIGGWLVLPTIGLFATPIYLLITILDMEYFSEQTWLNIETHGKALRFLVVSEMIYNFCFLGFTLVLILLFLKRRTSVPKLMVIFYAISISVTLLDNLAAYFINIEYEMEIREIVRATAAAIIWIPYFIKSERVKSTFCKTFQPRD
jgi:hypothetical protein